MYIDADMKFSISRLQELFAARVRVAYEAQAAKASQRHHKQKGNSDGQSGTASQSHNLPGDQAPRLYQPMTDDVAMSDAQADRNRSGHPSTSASIAAPPAHRPNDFETQGQASQAGLESRQYFEQGADRDFLAELDEFWGSPAFHDFARSVFDRIFVAKTETSDEVLATLHKVSLIVSIFRAPSHFWGAAPCN